MKRLILILMVISTTLDVTGQTVKIKLRVDDVASILYTIKQDMVADLLTVESKEDAVKSCEKVLKRQNANSGTIEVPEKYLLQWIEHKSHAVTDFENYREDRNRVMRVVNQLKEDDPKLELLRRSNASGYSALREFRKVLLRELKDDTRKTFDEDKRKYNSYELDDDGEPKERLK